MVKYFVDFDEAYAEWREDGGAMTHTDGWSRGEHARTWYVAPAPEIAEIVTCSPRMATEIALAMGGMRDADIDSAMADWQD
jgi:hypothetical protein